MRSRSPAYSWNLPDNSNCCLEYVRTFHRRVIATLVDLLFSFQGSTRSTEPQIVDPLEHLSRGPTRHRPNSPATESGIAQRGGASSTPLSALSRKKNAPETQLLLPQFKQVGEPLSTADPIAVRPLLKIFRAAKSLHEALQ